jgi:hypothetical protein
MSGDNPTLKDIWRLLGSMNKRFDGLERQIVKLREDVSLHGVEIDTLRAEMRLGFGALKEAIEARDFRLDDHGRRLTELESRS